MRRHVVAASLLVVACSAELEPTNPYDLATPPERQAKAIVRGALDAPTLASPAGLTVFLRANHQLVKQVQTAGDGAFLLDAVVPGSYVLEAAPQGFVPATIPVTLGPGQDLDVGTLTLAPLLGGDAATLSGTVTLQGQSAHGGILVEVVGRAFATVTDSTGAFRLEVPEGDHELRITHDAFVSATIPAISVGRGEVRTLDPIVLAGNPATVSGEVEAELAAGGWAPLADAIVTVEGAGVTGLSASGGAFTLPGVPAGSYVLRVVKDGYEPATYPLLNLAGGELRALAEPIRLALSRGRLEGRIALADATDAGGCIVEVTGTGRALVTGSDGRFSFDGLVSGTYELTVGRDGYTAQVRSGVAVPAGGTATVATVTLAPNPATVSGRVEAELAAGGYAPLGDAAVTLEGTGVTGYSAAGGTFMLTGVPAGSYVLRVVKDGYAPATYPVLNLAGGEPRALAEPIRLSLARGRLEGQVALADAIDAGGCVVEVTGTGRALVTASDGRFSFDGLVAGTYEITVRRDGYGAQARSGLVVPAGATATVATVTLAANPATVSGEVEAELAAGGWAPLADAVVTLEGTAVTALSTSGGAFTLPGVPAGSYVVRVLKDGYEPATYPLLNLAGGELRALAEPIRLALSRGRLEGRVALADATDAGGCVVEVTGTGRAVVTGADGTFSFDGLVAATYQVTVQRDGYTAQTRSGLAVPPGGTATVATITLASNPATVSGHVEAELAAGGYAPLADALVTVEGTGITALSASGGAFTVPGVPAGSYVLRVVKGGYDAMTYPVLSLAGGELRELAEPIRLALSRGRLEGRIALADATDAGGSVVEITGTGRAAVTASDGTFSFDRLLAGTYELTVRRDGYGGQVRSGVVVPAGGTATVPTITLARQGGAVSIQEAPYVASRAVTLQLSAPAAVSYKASEDPSFASTALGDVDWKPYLGPGSTRAFTLSDADGEHVVHVVYFDGTSPSTPASARVVLDRKAPSAAAVTINSGGAFANDTAVTLTLAAQDVPAPAAQVVSGLWRMEISNRADFVGAITYDYNVTSPWSLTPGDEAKTVWVRFTDRAGNPSAPASASVTLDTAAPAGTLALSGSGGFAGKTGSPVVTAALGASDTNGGAGNANLSVRLSNTLGFTGAVWQPFSSSLSWLLTPGDGPKTAYAQFRDLAGNVTSPPASGTIDLLTTPPSSGTLVLNGGAAATSSATVSCAISAVGATEMRLFVNGVAATGWIPYATTTSVNVGTIPDQATRVVAVSFRNGAGVEGGAASGGIRYDATAPGAGTLSLVGSLGNGSTSTAISSSAIVVANVGFPAAADAIEMALAQAATGTSPCSGAFATPAWQPIARTATVPLAGSDGDKRVCVLFRDAAGNSSAASAAAANVLLDTTPPTNPAFVNVASGTTRAATAPTVGAPIVTAATDAGTSVTLQCVGGSGAAYGAQWVDCGSSPTLPAPFALPQDQESTLGVRARDAAHNYSPGSFVRILQDSVAPFPPFITGIHSARDALTVSWDGTGDTDVAQYLVHYGNVAGRLGGTGAAQGPSPVPAGAFAGTANPSFTLTGLTPGLPYYVAIEAVDAAGNRSGPSGERLAVPSRANPRLLSSFGGQPRAVAILAKPAPGPKTFAYLGENQAIVQLDVSNDLAAPIVVGRAHLPDLVPNERGGVIAFPCTKGVTAGHCVVVAGTTLEGDYRQERADYPASSPVVFFPLTGASGAPVVGTIEAILPVRPAFVMAQVIAGVPRVYTVDRSGLRAFEFKAGHLAFLRQIARRDFYTNAGPPGVQAVLAATLDPAIEAIHAYVRVDPRNSTSPVLYTFNVADAATDEVSVYEQGSLLDDRGVPFDDVLIGGSYEAVPVFEGGVYVAWSDSSSEVWLGSYDPWDPSTPVTVVSLGQDEMSGLEPVGSAGGPNGHLVVLLSSGYTAAIVPASGTDLGTPYLSFPSSGPYEPISGALAVSHAGEEKLYVVEGASSGAWALSNWDVTGGATPSATYRPGGTFREIPPARFAESDRFVYVADGSTIHTIEAANPLTPTAVQSVTRAGRTYGKLVTHGRFLYAAAGTSGVEIFRMNGDGSLTYRTVANPGTVLDLAVAGKWLVTAGGNEIEVFDVESVSTAAPTSRDSLPVPFVNAVAARADDVSGTPWPLVVYAEMGLGVGGALQTFTFNGTDTLAPLSAQVAHADLGYAITVRGDYAAVSVPGGTWVAGVASPMFPSFSATSFPVAGPTLLQAGYLVGLGPVADPNGPGFALRSNGTLDGVMRFSQCTPAPYSSAGSLAWSAGLYAASCGRNGIALFTPASYDGGRLLKSFDVSPDWNSGTSALASDGMQTWFAGPMFGNERARLYQVNEQSTADPALSLAAPAYITTISGPESLRVAHLMQHVDGALLVVTKGSSVTVDAYDPWWTPWPLMGRLVLAGSATPSAIATDGEYLYVARNGGASGAQIDVVDVRNPFAPKLRATLTHAALQSRSILTLALSRDRLYAGVDLGSSSQAFHEVHVWDVSTMQASGTATKKMNAGAGEGSFTGLAVSGRMLFATIHDWNYRAPQFGVAAIRLGATDRDGNGAASLGILESDQPLASPVVAGDVLYVASNLGTRTYDLEPLWREGLPPVPIGGANLADAFWTGSYYTGTPPQLRLEGPFGFLVGGTYRVFDLR